MCPISPIQYLLLLWRQMYSYNPNQLCKQYWSTIHYWFRSLFGFFQQNHGLNDRPPVKQFSNNAFKSFKKEHYIFLLLIDPVLVFNYFRQFIITNCYSINMIQFFNQPHTYNLTACLTIEFSNYSFIYHLYILRSVKKA